MVSCRKICFVIPTFNRREFLYRIIKQIFYQSKDIKNHEFYIIVVVDGSTDGTLEMLKKEFPLVHTVLGNGSWWYTKSINKGLNYACKTLNTDLIITLNDDVQIEDSFVKNLLKNFIENLSIKRSNFKEIHSAITLIKGKKTRIYYGGNYRENYFRVFYYFPTFSEFNLLEHSDKILDTTRVTGRGLLFHVKALEDVGFFDEKFKQYKSDSDFGLRAIKIGYKLKVNYSALIYMELYETASDASYLKKKLYPFIKSFTRKESRNYIISIFRFNIRHKGFMFGILSSLVEILIRISNYINTKNVQPN